MVLEIEFNFPPSAFSVLTKPGHPLPERASLCALIAGCCAVNLANGPFGPERTSLIYIRLYRFRAWQNKNKNKKQPALAPLSPPHTVRGPVSRE